MKAIVVGAGRLGTQFANVLSASGHDVTVIEIDEDRLARAAQHLSARRVLGDACEPFILEEAGAHNTDLLVAATWDDEDNLVISLLAKRQFSIPRVVARVNDADNSWLFDQQWGVDAAIPSSAPILSLVEEATGVANTIALLRLNRAGVNLIETTIGPQSRTAGHQLAEVPLPASSVVAAVIRDGTPIVPDAQFRLDAGDELLIVSQTASEDDVHAAFQ